MLQDGLQCTPCPQYARRICSFIFTLDLPSTLIRHENGAFLKTFFTLEEFENAGFSFSCGRKAF